MKKIVLFAFATTAMITLLLSTQADAQCARQYCDSNGNCYYQQQRCTQYDHDTARAYNEQRGYSPYDSRGTMYERQRRAREMLRRPSRSDMEGPDDY